MVNYNAMIVFFSTQFSDCCNRAAALWITEMATTDSFKATITRSFRTPVDDTKSRFWHVFRHRRRGWASHVTTLHQSIDAHLVPVRKKLLLRHKKI
ncbi:hypothetical protein ASD32_01335 [Rhizobium sp. Root483D2]|nr:hypothetical protein ASD32_01335 [Rhizobium sp. Root483D2]